VAVFFGGIGIAISSVIITIKTLSS